MSTPLIQNDPAYLQIKDDIPSIIQMALLSIGKEDIEDLSNEEIYVVSLKSQYTIYLRLATASAPEFDVSAEQVSFKKGDRFFHYTSLAEKVAEELNKADAGNVGVAQIRITTRNGSIRNYNLSQTQKVDFKSHSVTSNSVELSWKMYNTSMGEFRKYTLLYSEKPVYDEYSSPKFLTGSNALDFYDIRRTKYRLMDLKSDTKYYLALIFYNRDGNYSIETLEIQTETDNE